MRMKRINLLMMLVIAAMGLHAANPGDACRVAIPLTKDFSDTIRKAGIEKWYSATTFDLPLAVAFVPDNGESCPAPEVEMDFSCISGYYEDSILCSLFCKTSGGSGLDFNLPYKQTLTKGTKDGKFAYTLSLGERYRDLLLSVGISYSVTVYVKVKYQCTGVLTLLPDAFTDCMDGAKFMHIGDTVQVVVKDKNRHVIVPYVQWQEDTIIYSWTGSQPCQLSVANTCDFDPTDNTDGNIIQFKTIQPNDTIKTMATYIYDWVHNPAFPNKAGMYYAKFYSDAPGVLKVTKAEQALPEGNATLLRYDRTYALDANSEEVFAIPRSWTRDVQFSTPTAHLFTMMIATSASFDDSVILKKYAFEKTANGRWIGILGSELKTFWNQLPNDKHYLYIRFVCTEATTVMPELWAVSACYTNTKDRVLVPGTTRTINKASYDVYRLSYADWVGGDMTITFSLNRNCEVYIADTCGMNKSKPDAPYWLKKGIAKSTAPLVIGANEIASWNDKINEEGCFYAMLYANVNGTRKVTLSTNAPAEKDPVYPASTIAVVCDGGKIVVNVSEAQTITVIDELGEEKDKWDAEPGTPHELNLTPGNYTLASQKEKISLKL